jgi:hypothetical protein
MLVPSRHQADRPARLARAAAIRGASGKLWPADRATELLEAIIESGDRVAIEGDNQKQPDFRNTSAAGFELMSETRLFLSTAERSLVARVSKLINAEIGVGALSASMQLVILHHGDP